MIRAHHAVALIGPNSIFGALQSRGYKVFPPNTPPGAPPEDRRYNGGYTVYSYGSGNPAGIDAIQLELGRHLRTDARFVAALGESIAVFYKAFLSGATAPGTPGTALQTAPAAASLSTAP